MFSSSLALDLTRRPKPPLVLHFISDRPLFFAALPSKSIVGTRRERVESHLEDFVAFSSDSEF
jgi:hypothetical protein